jgi:hypothetical protein
MISKRVVIVLVFMSCSFARVSAQFSSATGDKTFQWSGYVMPFFNARFYDANETDRDKNRFNLDFAVLKADYMSGKHWHSVIQINLPAIYAIDANDEFLMQATIEWRNRKDNFNIQAGYDKIPFSRGSLTPMMESPFMQRAEMVRGRTFNRRDMGVTLEKNFFNKRLNVYGGMYTGMGPASIVGDNDNSGNFLYAGRVEMAYPARFRYSEFDTDVSRLPKVALGGSFAYSEKSETTGDEYPILTVDGKKQSFGADVAFAYHGLSLFAEYVAFRITPNDPSQLFSKPTNYFLSQGLSAHLNYAFPKWKSVWAVRYDEFNPNDLIVNVDNRETLSLSYVYLLNGTNNCIKIHYFHRLTAQDAAEPWTLDQIRIGWQVRF